MRSQELQRSHMATVRALSNAVEARDAYTAKHAERVTAFGLMIARAVSVPGLPQIGSWPARSVSARWFPGPSPPVAAARAR